MDMNIGTVVALIKAMGGGAADPTVIEAAVQDWLDAHPEATTTVQDGSITEQKLATSIAQKLGLISSLSDEIVGIRGAEGATIDGWIQGTAYENTSMLIITDSSSTRCKVIVPTNTVYKQIVAKAGYKVNVLYAYKDGNAYYLVKKAGTTFVQNITIESVENAEYLFVLCAKEDNSAITPTEARANVFYTYPVMETVEKLPATVNAIFDSSSLFSGFSSATAVNASYYSGGVKEYGTASLRIINQSTFYFPVPVKLTAKVGYLITVYEMVEPNTFTGNKTTPHIKKSSDWVYSYTVDAYTNILIVVRKSSNGAIAPADWPNAVSCEMYVNDLALLTEKVNTVISDVLYASDGLGADMSAHGIAEIETLFSIAEPSGKTIQGMAVYGNVIAQGYSDGSISLIDMDSKSVIVSLSANGGHCGSLSFSKDFYSDSDEFPYLYCASYDENKTFKYRVTRSTIELIETYVIPTETAGYYQESAYDKNSGTLWVVGCKTNSYTAGTALIYSNWDISTSTPALIKSFEMPFLQNVQCIQLLNGQLFLLTGNDTSTETGKTRLRVLDTASESYKAVFNDFGSVVSAAEPEGIDFVLDGPRYKMILSTRNGAWFYKITIV